MMMHNNLGILSGFPAPRRPVVGVGPTAFPVAVQIGGINQGPGNDVFVGGNVSTTSPLYIPVTEVTTTPFTPTVSDYFLCVNIDGPASIVLPTTTTGRVYIVKDCDGDASTNPINITATGTTIDGAASATINTDYGSLNLVFNGTEWKIY